MYRSWCFCSIFIFLSVEEPVLIRIGDTILNFELVRRQAPVQQVKSCQESLVGGINAGN